MLRGLAYLKIMVNIPLDISIATTFQQATVLTFFPVSAPLKTSGYFHIFRSIILSHAIFLQVHHSYTSKFNKMRFSIVSIILPLALAAPAPIPKPKPQVSLLNILLRYSRSLHHSFLVKFSLCQPQAQFQLFHFL